MIRARQAGLPLPVLACAAALIAAGCAAPLKIAASADPLAVLAPGSMAYARLSGDEARIFAPSILSASEARALAPVLERTRIVALGLGAPSFQACLIGDYPFRTAALSLGADSAWKKEKTGFFNAGLGLHAALPGPSIVVASTLGLEGLLAAAKAPGPSPIPERLSGLASRELALWAPEPFSGLAATLLGEAMDVPALGMLIAAEPSGEGYAATIVFLMKDPDSARIFRPALRLAWYGIARGLLGDEAEGALGASFALEGDLYLARGVSLSAPALARALASLRDGLALAGPADGI